MLVIHNIVTIVSMANTHVTYNYDNTTDLYHSSMLLYVVVDVCDHELLPPLLCRTKES